MFKVIAINLEFKSMDLKHILYKYMNNPKVMNKIYLDGLLYFVEGKGLGSEFGFPRVEGKKKFRWKKMNFTT